MTANYPRWFLVIGAVYLLVGVALGTYMGGRGDFTLAPVHAHINLVGFALMSIFGLILRVIPAMAATGLAKVHFWLFQAGALIMITGLWLLISQTVPEATIGPVLLVGEVLVAGGVIAFFINLLQRA